MDEKTRELIAIGAAYAGDCEACLVYHFKQAAQAGASVDEIREAVGTGEQVKQASARRVDDLVERLFGRAAAIAA